MLGFSQTICPRASIAASAPGDGSADGHGQPAAGRRQAYPRWGYPVSPMTTRIRFGRVSRRARATARPRIMKKARA